MVMVPYDYVAFLIDTLTQAVRRPATCRSSVSTMQCAVSCAVKMALGLFDQPLAEPAGLATDRL